MTLIEAGSGPTHPSGPAGPHPSGPAGPAPSGPASPPPQPQPKHLVDKAYRLEVWTRDSQLLAVAEVRDAGIWAIQYRGHEAFYIGGREQAESVMRELVVSP